MLVEVNNQYQHLSIKDKKDPKAIINLVPSWFSKQLEVIPDEVFSLSEQEVRKRIGVVDERLERLRISFWQEYFRVTTTSKPKSLNIQSICGGICDHRTFQALIKNSFVLAFILMAPVEVNTALEELLMVGLKRMRELMLMPCVDLEGKFDKDIATLQVKLFQDTLNRRRGSVNNKIELESKNLHLHAIQQQKQQAIIETALQPVSYDIEKQILIEDTPASVKETTLEILEAEVTEHEHETV